MEDLTLEQIKMQEIVATVGTMGWQYLVEDLQNEINRLETEIHSIDVDDTLKYSYRGLCVAESNILTTIINKPERLLNSLRSFEK